LPSAADDTNAGPSGLRTWRAKHCTSWISPYLPGAIDLNAPARSSRFRSAGSTSSSVIACAALTVVTTSGSSAIARFPLDRFDRRANLPPTTAA
jgi:hypothetical protein